VPPFILKDSCFDLMIQSRKITHFLAVAEHLNFTVAATQLNISQPALSRSIKQLEEGLGVPLLERLPTGVVLTRYGEILARRARLMQLDAEHTLLELSALKTGSGGKVRIGAGPLWASVFLPSVIATLQRQHSGYQVEVTSGVIDTLVPAILAGQIDTFCSSLDFPNHPNSKKSTSLTSAT
jgi:DNA-binding transcriptional LysR family regulator